MAVLHYNSGVFTQNIGIDDAEVGEFRDLVQRVVLSGQYEWLRIAVTSDAEDGSTEESISSFLIGPGIPVFITGEAVPAGCDVESLNESLRARHGLH